MTVLGQNIKKLREERGWGPEEFADKLGVTRQSVYDWEADSEDAATPRTATLNKIANQLGVTVAELYKSSESGKLTSVKKNIAEPVQAGKKVPLYDAIAVGGNSMLADQSPISEPIDMVDPGDLLRSATGLLVVRGQSMFPKYPSGCYVAFKRSGEKIPAVIVWGEDYVIELEDRRILKRVEKGETKDHIRAVSYNVNKDNKYVYDPIEIHRDDVKRLYMVLGKVELEASI